MGKTNTPLIEFKNINVIFGQKKALKNINFKLYPQSIITIVGPNGGGKSTFLKVLLKLLKPRSGEVIYHQNIRIGYVPQKIQLDASLPLTVEKFLTLSFYGKKTQITNAMERLSIVHLKKQSLHRLSGGEMQRVLIARAILNRPNLLVLDEPTQGVDMGGQVALYQLIHQMQQELNCAVVMVSHDLHLVMADTKEVLCINQHLCCHGNPENLSSHPKFIEIFGDNFAKNLAFYPHHHNHHHHLDGEICGGKHCSHQGEL